MSSSHTQTKQVPRDAAVMYAILKEMGVTLHEPRVANQMLEFVYRYITGIVEEARVYSTYAKKKTVDMDDIRLAIKLLEEKSVTCVPPRDLLLDLAKSKNSQPLPLIKSGSGLRLPPDRYCLTQTNYQLQLYKKSIASSNSNPSNMSVRLGSSIGGFKTPLGVAPRSISSLTTATNPSPGISQPTIQFAANVQLGGIGTPTITLLANPSQQGSGTKRKFSEDDDPASGLQ